MPYLVNGQLVSADRVRAEEVRLQHDPQLGAIGDPAERARRLHSEVEFAAIAEVHRGPALRSPDPRPSAPPRRSGGLPGAEPAEAVVGVPLYTF